MHDLRTPLALIMGAAASSPGLLDENTRSNLATTNEEEAERLNRFIANLLDNDDLPP